MRHTKARGWAEDMVSDAGGVLEPLWDVLTARRGDLQQEAAS